MKENLPLSRIPIPDYREYRDRICGDHQVSFPLKTIFPAGIEELPKPINTQKTGWPWDLASGENKSGEQVLKVSVVVPSYQQGAYIEETIRSVLLQNYPELELIIIDGGSTDETRKVVDHYKDHISLFISEADKGQSQAINKGFSMASGDLYCWLNSDDFLNADSLNSLEGLFLKDNRLDIVYGDGYSFNEETGETTLDQAPLVLERYLRFGGIVLSHSLIWRSRVHCPVWEDLHCAMDAELWLRLFTGRKATHSQFAIGTARKHFAQKTANGSKWAQKWKDDYEKYIWKWYPAVKNWKWRVYEYRIVQRLYNTYREFKRMAF